MILRLLILPLLLGVQAIKADTTTQWAGVSEITFSGTSTLHDWAGKVSAEPFVTNVILDDAGQLKQVKAKVSVKAADMDTAEPKRDDNMKKAMKVTDHPLIEASMDAQVTQVAADGKTPTKLPLNLTLLDKKQSINATISHWKLVGKKATFDLDFDVSMKASGISVPAVLLFIRVGDTVKVHAAVTLSQL
ncbi:MAG: YceI family protein [Prosthecobacter sp.]|nr:YceI family protein [Prosthecobacter sp.]